jgi:hypothetical protein
VPWLSILSWAFSISGLALYAVNSKGAHDQALSVFSAIGVDKSTYLNRINAILSSYIITIALAVGCISVSCVAAVINIRHAVSDMQWNGWKSVTSITFYALSLLYCLSCTIWFVIVTIGVISWATCLWILERATMITINGMEAGAKDNCAQCKELWFLLVYFPWTNFFYVACSMFTTRAISFSWISQLHV